MCLQMQENSKNKSCVDVILGLKQYGGASARANFDYRFRVYLNNSALNVTFNRSRICDKFKNHGNKP